jgi:hypothetical protein
MKKAPPVGADNEFGCARSRLTQTSAGRIDKTYKMPKVYGMQSKLTLRMEESVIRKAKRLARKRGKSVSKIISEYITKEPDEQLVEELSPLTASMVGALGHEGKEQDYKKHLEEKYL